MSGVHKDWFNISLRRPSDSGHRKEQHYFKTTSDTITHLYITLISLSQMYIVKNSIISLNVIKHHNFKEA
jgi:hypothetical protein